jgi:hypothetical protein
MRHTLIPLAVLLLVVPSAVGPTAQGAAPSPAMVRIGVFDSRAVALAYYRTAEFQAETKQLMTDLAAARAANDKTRVDALEFQGPALQNLMHYQVFSTASIPNVIDKITPRLPKVAADAGVSAIVSKWDVAFKGEGVEYVDVTSALVSAFNPSPQVQQMMPQLLSQKPMPLIEAVKTLRPDK